MADYGTYNVSEIISYQNRTITTAAGAAMATDANNEYEMTIPMIVYGALFYTVISCVGVFGNILVLYVLMKEKELRNFTNYLLANLSLSDLMVLFTNVPSGLHDLFAKERWYLGKVWCYLVYFTEYCTGFASILTIFFITFERYYVICKPLSVKSIMTESRTLKLICLIWIVSITINLPFIFLTEYTNFKMNNVIIEDQYECRCNIDWRVVLSWSSWSFYYMAGATFVFYVIIGVVLIFLYIKISQHLKSSALFLYRIETKENFTDNNNNNNIKKSDTKSNIANNTSTIINRMNSNDPKMINYNAKNLQSLSIGDESFSSSRKDSKSNSIITLENIATKKNNLEKHINQRKQLIFMLICVLITFYLCLFPLRTWTLFLMVAHFRIKNFYSKLSYRTYWTINITVRIFFYLNSSINPIMYNFLSKKFRNGFKKLLIFRICASPPSPPPRVVSQISYKSPEESCKNANKPPKKSPSVNMNNLINKRNDSANKSQIKNDQNTINNAIEQYELLLNKNII